MNNDSFQELFKSKLDQFKEKTLYRLLSQDSEYQEACSQQTLAEEEYLLLNLTEDQRSTIDDLLKWMDRSNMEYSSLSYMAGLYDCQKLSSIFPEFHAASADHTLIRDFYKGTFVPAEQPYETENTRATWKELEKLETDFNTTLSAQQLVAFKAIADKWLEGVGSSVEDSFILGFQLGTKFLINALS